jgi:hypothetical protein
MGVGHAPNLGADPIHFLWQLRYNTGHNREFSRQNRYVLSDLHMLMRRECTIKGSGKSQMSRCTVVELDCD